MDKDKIIQRVWQSFQSPIGEKIDLLYSTSDGRILLTHENAVLHTLGSFDYDSKPLEDKEVKEWWRDDLEAGVAGPDNDYESFGDHITDL